MRKKDVYKEILNGNAVVITGSGVNVDVKNHEGDNFPIGSDLPLLLYRECGIDKPEDKFDLRDASQTFTEKKSENELIALLKKTYNVGEISDTVKTLYSLPWIRCYTTNYDDVPMLATDQKLIPVTINQSTKKYIDSSNCCVYINGYIGKLDDKTINTEFKLTTTSYMSTNNILNSQWGIVLKEDLECANVIIIAGLSLKYDLDLERIISNNTIAERVIFVEKLGISEDKKRKLGRFGQVWDIGVKEFVKELRLYAESEFVPQDTEKKLFCFEKNFQRIARKPATSSEVYELLMRGDIVNNLFWKNDGKYQALIYRDRIYDIMDAIDQKIKLVFVHANLGNGKSVILEILKQQLYKKGIETFTLIEEKNKREVADVDIIVSKKCQKVVFIENYFNHMDVLKKFACHNHDDITFVLTARTMVYDVKLVEVHDLFNIEQGQSIIVDINKLTNKEIFSCYQLIDQYEFWGERTNLSKNHKRKLLTGKKKGNYELQSILLEIINSSTIRTKLKDIVKEIQEESGDYYQSLVLMLLVKVMSIELRIEDINYITDKAVLMDAQYMKNSAVQELVQFSNDGKYEFKIKSAVVAKVILNDMDNSADIIDVLKKIVIYADNYSENVRFENILKNIVSFSHVNSFLNGKRDNLQFIIEYFDSLKNVEYYKDNSFYWLQYSIACMWYKNYELAQNYVDVAYGKFRGNGKNVPFQCDNQQARIYLEKIKNDKSENIQLDFERAHNLIMQLIISEKDREETTIRLLKVYVDKSFTFKIKNAGLIGLHKKFCGEAYNKISHFLKKLRNDRDRERYVDLQKKLLKASV